MQRLPGWHAKTHHCHLALRPASADPNNFGQMWVATSHCELRLLNFSIAFNCRITSKDGCRETPHCRRGLIECCRQGERCQRLSRCSGTGSRSKVRLAWYQPWNPASGLCRFRPAPPRA